MVLGIIVMASAYGIYISQSKGFVVLEHHTQATQNARLAIDQLSREMRMASFGVVGQITFSDAKETSVSFLGDIDSDINTTLAAAANTGATTISVDLEDEQDTIDSTDYIFLHSGGEVEMVAVTDTGDPYSLNGEPDTIILNTGLSNSYPASTTIVKSVETTTYTHNYGNQTLLKNGIVSATGISNLEFHYYNDSGNEMVPASLQSLNVTERAAIRRVEVVLQTQVAGDSSISKTYTASVDLRNMGARGFSADTCPPNAPTSLSISDTGTCGHFTAAWSAPTTNECDGTTITDLGGYKIHFGTETGSYFIPAFNVPDETVNEYQVADVRLENDTQYYVAIVAYDSSFNESSESSEVSFTLHDTDRPEPPENLEATSSVGSVTLTWDASEDEDASGYRVYRGTSADFTPSGSNMLADENTISEGTTEYTDSSVASCVTYYYKVSSVDCVGEGNFTEATYGDGDGTGADSPTSGATNTTASEDPATPPGIVDPFGASGSDQSILLSWTNPSDADFSHVIMRYSTASYPSSTTAGQEVAVVSCQPGSSSTYTHSDLTNGTQYYYSIFPVDQCGNVGDHSTAAATPNMMAPVVEITSPASGSVITNGQLVYQARGYDPDETNLSEPPSLSADNGKGISQVTFYVTPDPMSGQLPLTEYSAEYCGFGGDSNPCNVGDVSGWCSGTYNLYVVARDNESQTTQTPYTTIQIQGGGIELDDSYENSVTGTYKEKINFQIKNTNIAEAKLKTINVTWSRADARLGYVRIPDSSTEWSYETYGSPGSSGEDLEFTSGSEPEISADGTSTVQLEFVHNFATLTYSAMSGSTQITVSNASDFSDGDSIYVGDSPEAAQVDSINGNTVYLQSGISNSYSSGEKVSLAADSSEMPMTGVTLTIVFGYELTTYGQVCLSDSIEVTASTGPVIGTAYQDEPTLNTTMLSTIGSIYVENYRPVPVHAVVTDYSGMGISSMAAYYKVDSEMESTAPSSGYTSVNMTYDESDGWYEGTIPYATDSRIWVYFLATDANSATDRKPASGAYTYDLNPDTAAPTCPLGLTATVMGMKEVQLQWQANSEEDVEGYHIYRREECGSWAKKYTLVTDENLATPSVIDYTDNDPKIKTDRYCYDYYIKAVDYSENQSEGCEIYLVAAGDCPCGS